MPGSPAGASLPDQASEDPAIGIRGLSQTAWVTRTGTWRLELAVTGAPPGAMIETTIHSRVEERDVFNQALFGVTDGLDRKASIPPVAVDRGEAAAEGGQVVRLATTLLSNEDSRPGWVFLSDGLLPGVYPVEIRVLDGEEEIARTVVFLTRVPSDEEEAAARPPVLVAPVLPLGAGPTVDETGRSTLPMDVIDDITATAEGLAVAEALPATLVPRPETVEALDREPTGQAALVALRNAAEPRQVVDGPYVDVALTGWIDSDLGDELTRQRERGHRILTEHLGQVDSSTWVSTSALTPAAAAELWSVGVRTVVLPPDTVNPSSGATTSPFTITAGPQRTLQAVVPDASLGQRLVRRNDLVLDNGALAAELALLAASDDRPAGAVLLPPDEWPADAEAVAALAAVLVDPVAPVEPVTLAALVDAIGAGTNRSLRPALPENLGEYPQRLTQARSRLNSYASLTGPGRDEVDALDQRLLLSGARSLTDEQRRRYVSSVVGAVDARLAGIEAPTRQTITLTSRDGRIPLTLRSDLDQAVQVLIDLEADTRLDFPEGTRIVRTLAPGTNQIAIPVHARLPGDAPIDITVRTPDGAIVLDDVRYTVRSTAVSGIGLILSFGAALFLVLWWGRHWTQTRRARRTTEAEESREAHDTAEAMTAPDT